MYIYISLTYIFMDKYILCTNDSEILFMKMRETEAISPIYLSPCTHVGDAGLLSINLPRPT